MLMRTNGGVWTYASTIACKLLASRLQRIFQLVWDFFLVEGKGEDSKGKASRTSNEASHYAGFRSSVRCRST